MTNHSSLQIVIVDYDSGNLRSVSKALEKHGTTPTITAEPNLISDADAVILPGVGSGPSAMSALRARNLITPILNYISSGKPFLGVCLGLQLLLDYTEEGGSSECLGVIGGSVKQLPPNIKVPHMGWNTVHMKETHPIWEGISSGDHFYFVHSYYAEPKEDTYVSGVTEYGQSFCSMYAKNNLIATQFHPEKSGPSGLKLYRNFLNIAAQNIDDKEKTINLGR